MKKWISCLLFLHVCIAMPLFAADSVNTKQIKVSTFQHKLKKSKYLIVIRASEAVIVNTNEGPMLTLKGLDPKTLFFADRPARKAGLVSTARLMRNWLAKNSSYRVNPPNAAIIFESMKADDNGIAKAVVVELKNPAVVGKDAWSFKLKDLEGKLRPGNYNGVKVFIDSMTL